LAVSTLHDDEITIDAQTVRSLVDRDFPGHEDLPLTPLDASGSTNLLFRLGDDLLVRLPRQPGNGASIRKELRWGTTIGPVLPVATPEIIAVGEPGFGYPEPWSVVGWIDGDHPDIVDPRVPPTESRTALAGDLAAVITALRSAEVPDQALADPDLDWYRGRPLSTMDTGTRRAIEACRKIADLDLDLDAVLRVWDAAMRLPDVDLQAPPRWYHGDLLAENLLVDGDRLAAVLDFGSLSVGDPTIDLHGAWELLDPPAREVLRRDAGVGELEWLRGRAWALAIALGTFDYYWATMPERCTSRLAIARAVLAEAA
jgi:aminoglycoside phosphotransferase (APT) family kinase protein